MVLCVHIGWVGLAVAVGLYYSKRAGVANFLEQVSYRMGLAIGTPCPAPCRAISTPQTELKLPFCCYCPCTDHLECLKWLTKHPKYISNEETDHGATAVYFAAQEGRYGML